MNNISSYQSNFRVEEFVDRENSINIVLSLVERKGRSVIIFEGDRGCGKTALLLKLYSDLQSRSDLQVFFMGLESTRHPEFELRGNFFINPDQVYSEGTLSEVLQRIAKSFNLTTLTTSLPEAQKEYLARDLAQRMDNKMAVLLIDSIYERGQDLRRSLETYLLTPFLGANNVTIILSGRGKRPVWGHPDLRAAEIITLTPFTTEDVRKQLVSMKSQWLEDAELIMRLSGGYPLFVRILGECDYSRNNKHQILQNALDKAINTAVFDVFPKETSSVKKELLRLHIEKLALVPDRFRIPDIEKYLFPNYQSPEQVRHQTDEVIKSLLAHSLLKYERGGYLLNQSIKHPIQNWLSFGQNTIRLKKYTNELIANFTILAEENPDAVSYYGAMIDSLNLYAIEEAINGG